MVIPTFDRLLRPVLALAVAVYPRLPAGGRAGLAGVFGALALEGSVLAVADARAVGARGEDWTGIVGLPLTKVVALLREHGALT